MNNLEIAIQGVIQDKLDSGLIEKAVSEKLEEGIKKALDDLFGGWGDGTKVIKEQLKSVMIPYLEDYDYSDYILKLDDVLVDVLKTCTDENRLLLENFKTLMTPDKIETIAVSDLFGKWCKFAEKEVETHGLDVNTDDGQPTYEPVEVSMYFEPDETRSWSKLEKATVVFECEHDEDMNFEICLTHWSWDKEGHWAIERSRVHNIEALRRLNEFEVYLMVLCQNGTRLIIDEDRLSDEIVPEKEPDIDFS